MWERSVKKKETKHNPLPLKKPQNKKALYTKEKYVLVSFVF